MIRKFIKYCFDLHDIEDLRTGGHCGCCGAWLSKRIVPKSWPWCVCKKCG